MLRLLAAPQPLACFVVYLALPFGLTSFSFCLCLLSCRVFNLLSSFCLFRSLFFASPLLGACLSLNASFFLLAAGAGFPSSPPLFGEPPLHGSLFPLGAAFPLPPPAFAEALLAKLRYPVLNYHASAPSVQADFREASKSFFRICFR